MSTSEQSTVSVRAVVMIYDDSSKQWVHAGAAEGQSKIQIYHHPLQNTFRVVGRKLVDHEVVVNSAILKGLKYNQATTTFHQWRDRQQIYGLSFMSEEDADSFGQAMQCALDAITAGASTPDVSKQKYSQPQFNKPPQPQVVNDYNVSEYDTMYDDQRNSSSNQMMTGGRVPVPAPVMKAPTAAPPKAPAAPAVVQIQMRPSGPPPAPQPPPMAPPIQAAPAPPPVPPSGGAPPPPPPGGGPPLPPPPPPPPPMIGGAKTLNADSSGGGGLAAALAGAKLKKVLQVEEDGEANQPTTAGITSGTSTIGRSMPPPPGDMMSEMARKLMARKAKACPADFGESAPPSSFEPPKVKSKVTFGAPSAIAGNDTLKKNFGSPSTIRKTPGVPFSGGSSTSHAGNDASSNDTPTSAAMSPADMESLKQEIIQELRKEMHKIKDEIVQAFRDELSNNR